MALSEFTKGKCNVLWSMILGVTFVCCTLLIYYTLPDYGRVYSSTSSFTSPVFKQAEKLTTDECKSVCLSEDCIDIAYDIIKYMNSDVEPCEDFYEFACGNFREIYGPENNYSAFGLQNDLLQMSMKDIIETSEETLYPESAAQKLKTLYDSCMDTRSLELTDIQTMQTFLNQMGITNWPNLDSDFTFSNLTIGEALGRLLTFQEVIFFKFFNNKPQLRAFIPNFRCYNCTDEGVEQTVTAILQHAGMNRENIMIAWNSFADIQNAIGELQKNISEEGETSCENKENVVIDCKAESPQSKSLICEAADSMIHYGGLSSQYVADNFTMKCQAALYFEALNSFLKSYNHRSLAHYIALKVLLNKLVYMNISYRKFYSIIKTMGSYRDAPEKERFKFCVSYIVKKMNLPLGMMYVAEMFSQESIDELDVMVQEYQKTTSLFILSQDALPDDTKRKIIKEIENVKHLIIDVIKSIQNATTANSTHNEVDDAVSDTKYLNEFSYKREKYSKSHFARKVESEKNYIIEIIKLFKNKSKINEAYETFHPLGNNFLYNTMQLEKRAFVSSYLEFSPLEKQMNEYPGLEMIFEVNAANYKGIHLFFGILLPPFHKYEHPKLFKIARLGEVIAHEIGHTVYAVLKDYQKKDNRTRQYMEKNIGCRYEQYSQFELKRIGQKLKPNETENDDFADNMAAQVTESVVESLFQHSEARRFALPGTNFSAEELFYILYAQSECTTASTELEKDLWEEDSHSPAKYRIIGVFQNSERFSETFGCSATSYMNPQKKCPVFN